MFKIVKFLIVLSSSVNIYALTNGLGSMDHFVQTECRFFGEHKLFAVISLNLTYQREITKYIHMNFDMLLLRGIIGTKFEVFIFTMLVMYLFIYTYHIHFGMTFCFIFLIFMKGKNTILWYFTDKNSSCLHLGSVK